MEELSAAVADLPPGFRFHPTDEEIVTHYLAQKVIDAGFTATAIGEADLNKCEPWDLPQKAKMGEKEWYFFCQRDRKYPTGMRTNRATQAGYWKATGKDREIFKGKGCLAGMKKTLVFYRGRAPKGEKTNWVMHEFRLEGKFSHQLQLPKSVKDEWVVCRVFHKNVTTMTATKRLQTCSDFSSLSPLMNSTNHVQIGSGFDDAGMTWRPPAPSGYHLKYFSIRTNDHHLHLRQPEKLPSPLPTPTYGATMTMIPTPNPFPPIPEDAFFSFEEDGGMSSSFEQLAGNGTPATECKMEPVSCSMMSGLTQEISPSINNCYEADLDLWDY